jgi:uncharacterized membrane protein SpoIIM required for sporulation
MKESKFIEQNKKNWQEFETDLRYRRNKATKLSRLFVQVTDDLSFVRTFYKHRSVKIYLNGIGQHLFNDLYRNQSGNLKGFMKFWRIDLPLLIHDSRKEFRISFIVFLLSFSIGILSSIYDKDFARLILGESYVKMTIENIQKNDPMAVYKSAHAANMFLGITINNLMVALYTFLMGVILAIGSVFSLIYNGVMVGVFQYFFIERGLFKESFLTIWQHGTLEISAIIIAGAAGITLGKGLVFPGTYSRLESFKISALRGLKIFLSITPVIIMAAFIEGFLTRHTELNPAIRISVIIISLLFILFYFVWYPRFLSKRHPETRYYKEKPGFKEIWKLDFSTILSAEEILGYTFKFVTQRVLWIFMLAAGFSCFHALAAVIRDLWVGNYDVYAVNHSILAFFETQNTSFHFWIGLISLSLLQILFFIRNRKLGKPTANNDIPGFGRIFNLVVFSLIGSFLLLIPFKLGLFWGIVSLVFLSPIVFLTIFQSFVENISVFAVIPSTRLLMQRSWGKLYWNSLKIFVFILILYVLLNTPLVWKYVENVYQNFNFTPKSLYLIDLFTYTFFVIFLFSVYFIFQIMTAIYSYFAFRETVYADNLKERIERFGERNIMFGFEKEF